MNMGNINITGWRQRTDLKRLTVRFGSRSSGASPLAMTFSLDGRYLVTALGNQTALVWELARVLAKKTNR
jgi:hypothetical protein